MFLLMLLIFCFGKGRLDYFKILNVICEEIGVRVLWIFFFNGGDF